MKSKLSPKKIEEERELEFPLLMINPQNNNIFLIVAKRGRLFEGMRLYTKSNNLSVGAYSTGWATEFVPYEGSIELSN